MKSKFVLTVLCVFILTGCNTEIKKEKKWVLTNLSEYLWRDVTYNAVNDEYHRLCDAFVDMANDAITAYSNNGLRKDYEQRNAAYFWGLGDLYELGGGNTDNVKKRNATIEKYKTHFGNVTDKLSNAMGSCLHLRDSVFICDPLVTDSELFKILYGTPGRLSQLTDDEVFNYGKLITIHTLENVERPVITNCEYNKDYDLWMVRVDNTNNQYVKFYKRNDGDYDVEYSDELKADGTPNSEDHITISF